MTGDNTSHPLLPIYWDSAKAYSTKQGSVLGRVIYRKEGPCPFQKDLAVRALHSVLEGFRDKHGGKEVEKPAVKTWHSPDQWTRNGAK